MLNRTRSASLLIAGILLLTGPVSAQEAVDYAEIDATEIIRQADKRLRGESSYGETAVKIVRPDYTREMVMVGWSKGTDLSLILITEPSRDAGSAFLKRDKEIWNWLPTIERTVKLPPSMMSQNWMGTDFTNDDLVRESSIVSDYTHRVVGREQLGEYQTWKIELVPHEDAAVVWGRILVWIEEADFMQMRVEFFDEDDFLVNTMIASNPTMFGGKRLPAVLEMSPADKEGHKTIMETRSIEFDIPIEDNFFTVRNMRSVSPKN